MFDWCGLRIVLVVVVVDWIDKLRLIIIGFGGAMFSKTAVD